LLKQEYVELMEEILTIIGEGGVQNLRESQSAMRVSMLAALYVSFYDRDRFAEFLLVRSDKEVSSFFHRYCVEAPRYFQEPESPDSHQKKVRDDKYLAKIDVIRQRMKTGEGSCGDENP